MQPIYLDPAVYRGVQFPFDYVAREHYQVSRKDNPAGWTFSFDRNQLELPVKKGFMMELYPDYIPSAEAYGFLQNDCLIAMIQWDFERWNQRFRITDLWVDPSLRRRQLGKKLMLLAETRARTLQARMMILETQSCNVGAIDFYQSMEYQLIGCDWYSYTYSDPDRYEVRMEWGKALAYEKVTI